MEENNKINRVSQILTLEYSLEKLKLESELESVMNSNDLSIADMANTVKMVLDQISRINASIVELTFYFNNMATNNEEKEGKKE